VEKARRNGLEVLSVREACAKRELDRWCAIPDETPENGMLRPPRFEAPTLSDGQRCFRLADGFKQCACGQDRSFSRCGSWVKVIDCAERVLDTPLRWEYSEQAGRISALFAFPDARASAVLRWPIAKGDRRHPRLALATISRKENEPHSLGGMADALRKPGELVKAGFENLGSGYQPSWPTFDMPARGQADR